MPQGFAFYPFNLIYRTIQFLCIASIILIGLCNTALASAASQNTHTPCQANIEQITVAKGDLNQEMQRPTKGWIKVEKLPDQWGKRWPDFHGMAWYKITVNYPCSSSTSQQPISLAIEGITQSGRVFINNELLWQDDISAENSSRSQYQPRFWNLPASSLKQGQNIIWVQVYGSITKKSGLGHVHIGTYSEVKAIYKMWLLEKNTMIQLNTMINMVIGILYLLAWLANRNEKAFFWIALSCLAWVIYSCFFLFTDAIPYLTPIVIDRIQNIIFCFYTIWGCLGAWYFANRSFPRINIFFIIFLATATLGIAFTPVEHLSKVILFFFTIAVLIFVAKCVTYPFIAYKAKLPETYILAALYLLYLPIAFNDAHFMITMEGHPIAPYTGPFTTMAVGGVLALRLARHKRQIERFNKTLTEKVQQAEQNLTVLLGQQHQLALENARLQERIQLSHDLHDGLGGSLIRSMILIEQNDQVEKSQIMSILKLFRNDLRQVIDSGSSIAIKVPESPTAWAAPIRHRFIQLFEELDIHSKWSFEKQWHSKPTAAQCLTLTRIIEEALTNIIKHSQATQVSVALSESENRELVLKIQDNGVGFDPSQVEKGLHVGLHSMQVRISRMNGVFKIDSQRGQTAIQVILPLNMETSSSETLSSSKL